MALGRRQLGALLGLLLLGAAIGWLALRNRQAPPMPRDEEHRGFVSGEACAVCHGPDGPLPRSKNHPLGQDCTRCHGFSR